MRAPAPAFFLPSLAIPVLLLASMLAGCDEGAFAGRDGETTPRGRPSTITPITDRFLYVEPLITKMRVPYRFSAPLPATYDELEDTESHPPQVMIVAALAAGDAAMQRKVLQGVRRAARDGDVPEEIAAYYGNLFGWDPSAATCKWLHGLVTGRESPTVRRVFWTPFARCDDLSYAPAFRRDDAPDAAIIEWYVRLDGVEILPLTDRLERAVRNTALYESGYALRVAGLALARAQGPRVPQLVRELQNELVDPEERALLALGLGLRSDARSRALFQAACMHPKVSEDSLCSRAGGAGETADEVEAAEREEDAKPPPLPPLPPLVYAVAAYDADLSILLRQHGRLQVLDALASCVEAGGSEGALKYGRGNCLERLASLDRPRAVAVAKALPRPELEDWLAAAVDTLLRFPEPGALEAKLRALGLLTGREPAPAVAPSLDVGEMLRAYGRAYSFDTETDQYPNAHDGLLLDLAPLVAPALDGAFFEEITPAQEDDPYVVRAYMDGRRYEVKAQNFGDWYDVGTVLGLLNTLLVARGSELRFVTLATGDQTATVVAGPREGLLTARREKLLRFGAASDGMQKGKVAEQRVLEVLQLDAAGGTRSE